MFKTTLLLLDIAKPAQLDSYAELIRKQSEEHGPTCWSIIYQADVRMRSEEFDRIRRRMSIDFYKLEPAARLVSYFNPADPWNTIFQLSHPDASHKADRFWQVEVKDKCTAYLTQIRTWNHVMDDGASNNRGPGYQSTFQGGKRQRLQNNNNKISMLYYAFLFYALLCLDCLGYALLCYALLCSAMFGYAML